MIPLATLRELPDQNYWARDFLVAHDVNFAI